MDEIPKIKPEIKFIAENEDSYALLCGRLKEMEFDDTFLEICVRKKFLNVSIGYNDYARRWYLEEVLDDFLGRIPFWNDDSFAQFVLENKIKFILCIVVYQYGTYPGMSIGHKELSVLTKFNGDLDFDIY